ncbi:MAG: TonB-dependent receptor [Melioribacter sp.]|nr:TonB-dependent receptor [Melioribacter sp.]
MSLLFLVFLVAFINNIYSQNSFASLSGFVYDSSTGEGLIGANVYLKGVNLGASTNLSGYYVIPHIRPGKYELIVSYVGYKTFNQEITLRENENRRLDIKLVPTAILSEEVVVSADSVEISEKLFNKPVSKIEITPAQIGKIPQVVESDLLRTLQSLPGIMPISDFSSAIYVRGGTPDQNLFLVDGTEVYNPEHAFGLFSTFNTDAIKKVEVYKGGFGAEFGGRLSSVINIINNDGNRNNFEGKASLSLLSFNTTLQTPIGKIGSLSGSFRRTYMDQTVAKFIDDIPDYYFMDGNFKAFFDLNNSNKLSISFYGGIDDLNFTFGKDKTFGFKYQWGNQTGSINWRTVITPKLFGNFWFTFSRFFSEFLLNEEDYSEKNRINDVTLKGALEYFYNEEFSFKFGTEWKNVNGGLKQEFPSGKVDVTKYPKLYSSYFSSNWKPYFLWSIEAGVRLDYLKSDKDYYNVDPRLTIKYRLNEKSSTKISYGIVHQYAHQIPRVFMVSIWTASDENIRGSKAEHYILGYQRELGKNIEFEIEAYFKNYKNIYSFNPNLRADIEIKGYSEEGKPVYGSTKGIFNRGDGKSYGIELLIRKDFGALTGWLAYTLAKTEFVVENINKGNPYNPRHDRTHAINFVVNIDMNNFLNELYDKPFVNPNKKWSVGLSFTYFSGQPITLPSSVYLANSAPDWEYNLTSVALYPTEINKYRLPYYARFDLTINYEIKYKGWSLIPYLQVFNLFNRKNVWFIQYERNINASKVELKTKNITMFPILPSLGVSAKF